jgi:FlaA1/EpsC-like NDP-sugar epimerase
LTIKKNLNYEDGMCKSVSERIMIEKTQFLTTPKFVNVRYGNVLSSRGSLLPFYKNLVKDDKTEFIPVTDSNMTRYFMTLDDSVDLINYSILYGKSGDTVIPKHIYSYKIIDIANYFSNMYNIPVKITGIRPGEKIHETLISYTESLRTVENDSYYVIKPTYFKMTDKCMTFPNEEQCPITQNSF